MQEKVFQEKIWQYILNVLNMKVRKNYQVIILKSTRLFKIKASHKEQS